MLVSYALSLIGTSHVSAGIECQDSSRVETLPNGWIVAAIADGLGSAVHSKEGSEIAVNTVIEKVQATSLPEWNPEMIKILLTSAYSDAMLKINSCANEASNPIEQYDTTLTSLIYDGMHVAYLHVGDGGIVALNKNGRYSVLTTAQKGDAFNEVVPLRAGIAAWEFGVSDPSESICSLLMMTDGIYDVACPPIFAKARPELPIQIKYVRQFMDRNKMPIENQDECNELKHRLEVFYSGLGTRDITDDKTILGIMDTAVVPAVLPDEYYADPDLTKILAEQQKRLYEGEEIRKASIETAKQDEAVKSENEVTSTLPVKSKRGLFTRLKEATSHHSSKKSRLSKKEQRKLEKREKASKKKQSLKQRNKMRKENRLS